MKTRILFCVVSTLSLSVWFGCSHGPAPLDQPKVDASEAGRLAVEQYDSKKTGKISGPDLDACPSIKSIADQLAGASGGGITADMIAARIRQWQDMPLARLTPFFHVTHNGAPLAKAVVTLVPEKFLGPSMKPGTGTADDSGNAMPSVPSEGTNDFGGMPCGFYRVEITKPGENIPATYNTATTLGVEISLDKVRGQPLQFEYDLKY